MITTATGRGKLYGSLKDMRILWDETEKFWNDEVRQNFEEKIFDPLVQQCQSAIRAMNRVAQLMAQVQNECE
jgi:hypothetical protein